MHKVFWVFCALLCLPSAPVGRRLAAADPAPDLDTILRDWEFRRQQTRSLSYRLIGTGLIPKGTYTNDYSLPPNLKGRELPASDHSFDLAINLDLDFVNGLARVEVKREVFFTSKGIFAPFHEINLYDGKKVKRRTPRDSNMGDKIPRSKAQPDLWEDIGPANFFQPVVFPLFFAHGRVPRDCPDPTKLNASLDPSLFRAVGFGEHAGHRCAIVRVTVDARSNTVDEFWIDEGRRSAVVRWLRSGRNRREFDSTLRYSEVPAALWPDACDWTWYHPRSGAVLNRFDLKVAHFRLNPELNRAFFHAEAAPGLVVHNKSGFFKVQDDGSLTKVPLEPDAEQTEPVSGWRVSRWAVALIAFSLGAVALTVFLRRRGAIRGVR